MRSVTSSSGFALSFATRALALGGAIAGCTSCERGANAAADSTRAQAPIVAFRAAPPGTLAADTLPGPDASTAGA